MPKTSLQTTERHWLTWPPFLAFAILASAFLVVVLLQLWMGHLIEQIDTEQPTTTTTNAPAGTE